MIKNILIQVVNTVPPVGENIGESLFKETFW